MSKLAPSSGKACKYRVIAASLVKTTCETWHHGSTPTPWDQGELRRQHLTKWPNMSRSVRAGQRTLHSLSIPSSALALPCLLLKVRMHCTQRNCNPHSVHSCTGTGVWRNSIVLSCVRSLSLWPNLPDVCICNQKYCRVFWLHQA